ncbi:MAG: hypothetical protein ACYTKD_29240 [Planctomycetota bacterium]|jgi:hypothetical protein
MTESGGKPTPGSQGLPLEVAGVTVDARGFSWKAEREPGAEPGRKSREHLIPWGDVRAVAPGRVGGVRVEGVDEGEYRLLLSIPASPGEAERIGLAWREYLLGKVEREGMLKGSVAPAPERRARWLLMAGIVVIFAAITWRAAGTAPEREARRLEWFLPVALIGVVVIARAGVEFIAIRRDRALGVRWERWEITRRGIAYFKNKQRCPLEPSPGDRVTPESAVIAGERVPVSRLTMQPVAGELVMALAERAGARVYAAWPAYTWLYMIGGVCAAGLYATEGEWLWLAALAAAVLVMTGELAAARARFRERLARGREAIARLGW